MSRPTDEQVLAAVKAANGDKTEAGRRLGITRDTVRRRLVKLGMDDVEADPVESVSERERRRFKDETARLKRDLAEANRQLNGMEDLRSSLFGLVSDPLQPRDYAVSIDNGESAPEIPVLFTSDFQWGEVIDLEGMGGLNGFNRHIAAARYRRLIEKTIALCRLAPGGPPPVFYYLRGGDAISGEIHDELERTNDLLSLPALRDLAEHEAWGIERLADELACPIIVISVPGNHDRSTKKPQSKGYVETSYDSVISWFLESHFKSRGDTRITFQTPKTPDALFTVYNRRFLMTHGDQTGAGGGQGFIGPAATITRGMKRVVDYYAGLGITLDVVLLAHWHTAMQLEYGYSNGCLPGYSEYARKFRMKPKPPTQWLFHVHPKHGITTARQVMVGGPGEGTLCEHP